MSPAMKQLDENLGKCTNLKDRCAGGGPCRRIIGQVLIPSTRKPLAVMLKRQIMNQKSGHLQKVVIGGEASCAAQ
jgi:hypothetical protein